MNPSHRRDTQLIHAGELSPRVMGAVATPIFQSAMFEYSGETSYHDLKYIRLNNTPNHTVLHAKLAALEGGEAGLVTASGMAAISTALLAVLGTGGHLLAQSSLYGGTHSFITHDLPTLGHTFDLVDAHDPAAWKAMLRPSTRAFYVESITNPLMAVAELEEVARFCREHGLVSLIDNTFTSPLNFRPLEWGFDLSLHSGTKYLNGHSDIVAGAVIGSQKRIEAITYKLNHLGGSLDPHACFLLHRGMKTLGVRVRHQNASTLRIARFLADHPGVERVNYPGLPDHPDHGRAARWFDGFSGMLSFEIQGGVAAADTFLRKLQIGIVAPSLGGVETLATRPSLTSHVGMGAEQRKRAGIAEHLIRISIGIEDPDDLIADFDQALQHAAAIRAA